jgi:hypothetical protein
MRLLILLLLLAACAPEADTFDESRAAADRYVRNLLIDYDAERPRLVASYPDYCPGCYTFEYEFRSKGFRRENFHAIVPVVNGTVHAVSISRAHGT